MKNYLKQFNIIALVETWSSFKGEFNDFLSGYTYYDCVRNENKNPIRNSGGVGVFISDILLKQIKITQIFLNFENCIVLHLNCSCFKNLKDIIMYFAYVSPESSSIYDNGEQNGILILENNIIEIRSEYQDCLFFLEGDLNSRTTDFFRFYSKR